MIFRVDNVRQEGDDGGGDNETLDGIHSSERLNDKYL
jgi:hypothetical protein